MNLLDRGRLAMKRGDYQEAINIFKRLLDQGRDAEAFVGFGMAHERLGDMPTARWAMYKALELKKDHQEALASLGRIDREKKETPPQLRKSLFRVGKDHLEIKDGAWKKFFIKGVNLGLGLPGYFPGEYAVKKGTYLKWFRQMTELGANSVRIYTILPPDFYEALYQFNRGGGRLYLFQEIWTEFPERNDYRESGFLKEVSDEIMHAVDAVFGNAVLPERPGHAHGRYAYDVSPFLAGFIFGSEWESCTVRRFNELHQRELGNYHGEFLQIDRGTPFEVWITEQCDFLQQYEYQHYQVTHPVSAVNWVTLDPLTHPSESTTDEESRLQGIAVKQGICNNDEDTEVLDTAKIQAKKGNGYFPVYHAYPYYPDFMSNDYLKEKNTYLAYLRELKKHHGSQPVLIAEFGVPTSRESAHWHRDGWGHGGHSERSQGEIDGLLMRSIHEAGMAGGVVFSWFDEWFKKNWNFQPYELPHERKPLWFNFQDPEESYGLLAMYPSYPAKKVMLAARQEDWKTARTLYEKQAGAPAFRFDDGADAARELVRLSVQHDEGFLYLLLTTRGAVDFDKAHYLIGLATCPPEAGERLLPFGTGLSSPVGLTFLLHLAGEKKSRILAAQSYDKYLNAETGLIRPEHSDQGAWVMMQNHLSNRRISKDGKRFFPARVSLMSRLKFGSLDPKSPHHSSLADFFYQNASIEVRIPWGLINVTDPSSRNILWMDGKGKTRKTKGIGLFAVSYKPDGDCMAARRTGKAANHTDSLPAALSAAQIDSYSWDGWETPIYHSYLKESYYRYQKVLQSIPETP